MGQNRGNKANQFFRLGFQTLPCSLRVCLATWMHGWALGKTTVEDTLYPPPAFLGIWCSAAFFTFISYSLWLCFASRWLTASSFSPFPQFISFYFYFFSCFYSRCLPPPFFDILVYFYSASLPLWNSRWRTEDSPEVSHRGTDHVQTYISSVASDIFRSYLGLTPCYLDYIPSQFLASTASAVLASFLL